MQGRQNDRTLYIILAIVLGAQALFWLIVVVISRTMFGGL